VNLLAPVPWLKLVTAGVLFAIGLYVGAHWVQGRWDASVAAQEAKYIVQLQAANAKTLEWQGKANTAETNRAQAATDLATYLAAHPVSVLVCPHQGPKPVPDHPPGQPAGTEAEAVLQPKPTDIGPALDQLMAEADTVNENYRLCRASYLALKP
jgi:hypothetical protein